MSPATANPQKNAEFPSDQFLLTDINNVPELSTVSSEQAMSYLNQSLENLILVYQSTATIRSYSDDFNASSLSSEVNSSSPSAPSSKLASPPSFHTTKPIEPFSSPKASCSTTNDKTISPSTESEAESVLSGQSPGNKLALSSSSSSSSSSLTSTSAAPKSQSDGNTNEGTRSNSIATITPPQLISTSDLARPSSSNPTSILEEAAVVAAVLIEGTEHRRRSSGRLAPVDTRIVAPIRDFSGSINEESINDENEESTQPRNNDNNGSAQDADNNDNTRNSPNDTKTANNTSSEENNINKQHKSAPTSPTSVYSRSAISKKEMEQRGQIIRRFWSRKPPEISVWKYLQRIHRLAPLSTSVYLSASLYIYRLCIELQTILLTPLSVHRILLASLRIACKTIEDISYKQRRFAIVGGVVPPDLYRLEIAFLYLIDFDVCINSQILQEHMVMLTELHIQAERHRQLLSKKRPRSADPTPQQDLQS